MTPFREKILFTKLKPEATLPQGMTIGAVGFDLFICEEKHIQPNETVLLSTGIATAIPDGFEGQIRLRSSTGLKTPLIMPHGVGTIDPDYRGELLVLVKNLSDDVYIVKKQDRIAQLVICPVVMPAYCDILQVDKLPPTTRGVGGLGSTN